MNYLKNRFTPGIEFNGKSRLIKTTKKIENKAVLKAILKIRLGITKTILIA